MFAVDDVTVGTSAPVEQLASAAMAGDHHALHERSRMLSAYTRSLKEMASAAVSGLILLIFYKLYLFYCKLLTL